MCYIRSTLHYGIESWTQTAINSLEESQMWIHNLFDVRVPWVPQQMNDKVLKKTNVDCESFTSNNNKRSKLAYLGLERRLLQTSAINIRREEGRPKRHWKEAGLFVE